MATDKKKKDEGFAAVMPWLVGAGLVGGGLWLWSKSQDGDGNGIPPGDHSQEVKNLLYKTKNQITYTTNFTKNGRTPTEAESSLLTSLAESIRVEELQLTILDQTDYRDSLAHMYQDLGLFVVIPVVVGFMAAGAFVRWYLRSKGPPKPPQCPKDGYTVSTPELLQAHVEEDHSITTDPATLAAASAEWNTQPFWVASSVGVIGQTYSTVYNPMLSWNMDALKRNVGGMSYAYGAEMGTMGTLSALSRVLMYCLI